MENIYLTNNIFYSTNNYLGYFQGFLNKNSFQMSAEYDNYFCENPSKPLFVIKEIHGQYFCHDVFDVNQIQSQLKDITGSTKISFLQPTQLNPGFLSTDDGGFVLNNNSSLINKGRIINGFYDFKGSKPDIGAKETDVITVLEDLSEAKNISIYPNPSTSGIQIDFNETVDYAQVHIYNVMGQLMGQTSVKQVCQVSMDLPEASGLYVIAVTAGNAVYKKIVLKSGG